LVERDGPPAGVFCVMPRGGTEPTSPAGYRRVLCTAPDFRAFDLWSVRSNGATVENGHPAHLVDVLLGKRMPLPSGARWVEYAVPDKALVHEIPRAPAPHAERDADVAEIRYRLNRRTPIPLRDVVAIARAFRDAAVEAHQR